MAGPARLLVRALTRAPGARGRSRSCRATCDAVEEGSGWPKSKRAPRPYEISPRVELQASTRPYNASRRRTAHATAAHLHARSVGLGTDRRHRDRGRAVRGSRVRARRARCSRSIPRALPAPLKAEPLDLDQPYPAAAERPVAVAGQRPVPPPDGVRRLQPDVRGVPPRARPRRRVGMRPVHRNRGDTLRLRVRPFAFSRRERLLRPRRQRPVVRLLPRR